MECFNYKGGTIRAHHPAPNNADAMAYRHGRTWGPYRTVAAAKAALTRYHAEWRREMDTEHAAALAAIRGEG